MVELTQLPFDCLINGCWYVGRGRNGNVGKWDGERKAFLVIGWKLDEWRIKLEPYYTDERGCFQPYLMVDDGQVRETLGSGGWDEHYAGKMDFSIAPLDCCTPDDGKPPLQFGKLLLLHIPVNVTAHSV